MKNYVSRFFQGFIISCFICLSFTTSSFAGEYEALNSVKEVKAVFDVRAKSPKSTWIFLDLIHKTFKEKNILEADSKPEFVVVFIGPAVKNVSTNIAEFSEEDKKMLAKIADTVSAMAKDGIKLEICLYAANLLGVDPATILPEIKKYENGWISLIGYQANGYTLVPAY